jgi:MFS transporter, DHA1 family, inner membrane transport protein
MVIWIFSLSAAFAVALNGTMVMPMIVIAIDKIPGYDEGMATLVASAEILGIALYSLILPGLAARYGRMVALVGFAAVIAGELASFWMTGVITLTFARLIVGLGEGAIFSMIASRLASLPNAERLWGAINLIGGGAMGLLLLGVSVLSEHVSISPIFLVLAGFSAVMAPLVLLIGRNSRPSQTLSSEPPLDRGKMALVFVILFLIYGVQAGQWAISGFIGQMAAMTPSEIGSYLAISSVLGFVGAIIPSLNRDRSKRLVYVMFGFAVMAASLYVFFHAFDKYSFLIAQTCLNIGFYMLTPFVTGLVTENDPDGALLSRVLVISLIGAGVGTGVAGPIFTQLGAKDFGWIFMAPLIIAAAAATGVFGRLHADMSTRRLGNR